MTELRFEEEIGEDLEKRVGAIPYLVRSPDKRSVHVVKNQRGRITELKISDYGDYAGKEYGYLESRQLVIHL